MLFGIHTNKKCSQIKQSMHFVSFRSLAKKSPQILFKTTKIVFEAGIIGGNGYNQILRTRDFCQTLSLVGVPVRLNSIGL
jgi:hypothetical protein